MYKIFFYVYIIYYKMIKKKLPGLSTLPILPILVIVIILLVIVFLFINRKKILEIDYQKKQQKLWFYPVWILDL